MYIVISILTLSLNSSQLISHTVNKQLGIYIIYYNVKQLSAILYDLIGTLS